MSEPCLGNPDVCKEVVKALRKDLEGNVAKTEKINTRVDGIMAKLNITLGSAVASLLLLILNFLLKGN